VRDKAITDRGESFWGVLGHGEALQSRLRANVSSFGG
jgi:hypothetical protein